MSEEHIIRYGAPTLAGIKTGNLFLCGYVNKNALLDDIRRLNRRLSSKGLRILPLRFSEKSALIYIFRPKKLNTDLSDSVAVNLLKQHGYQVGNCDKCVVQLIERLRCRKDFPHEIGLFLGYPPEDVCGFIENGKCKCVGYWKVYGDEDAAKRKFARFDKCSQIYSELWSQGRDIEGLTVAV